MKFAWIVFGSLLVLLSGFGLWQKNTIRHEHITSVSPETYADSSRNGGLDPEETNPTETHQHFSDAIVKPNSTTRLLVPKPLLADSIVQYGLSLMGIPYLPAGITCEGFDCSGFIYHIFDKYGVKLPHSSAMLIKEGSPVPLAEARKGDLIVFTGTNSEIKKPGHVGVVITNTGEPIQFVHSSSATRQGGVKISKVDGTGYARRFLEVRRVL